MEPEPELVVVSDLDPDSPLMLSLASQLLEMGICFSGLEACRFPRTVPRDLSACKALLIPESMRGGMLRSQETIDRIDRYTRRGGLVYWLPDTGADRASADAAAWHMVNYIVTDARLTPFHPGWKEWQDRRPVLEVRKGFEDRLMEYLRAASHCQEFNLHYWKAALFLLRSAGREDVREALEGCIRRCYKADWPSGITRDELSGLFATAWLFEATGERELVEQARALIDGVIGRRFRIGAMLASAGFADDPLGLQFANAPLFTDNRSVSWTENLHMLCPALASMTRVFRDERYLAEALEIATYVKEKHQDADGLIRHCVRDGQPGSAKWSRGMAHALMGLLYVLEEMKPDDARREMLLETIQRGGRGLRNCQDPGTGLWRNVLDSREARLESSGSACFAYVYGRGIEEGWLDSGDFSEMVQRAVAGLKRLYWRGGLGANCRGTGTGPDPIYYLSRPQGWGIVPWFLPAAVVPTVPSRADVPGCSGA